MWHALAIALLAYISLRWFDAAADAEAELRRRDEAERKPLNPRDYMDV